MTATKDLGVDGRTIGEMFQRRAQATPDAPAYRTKRTGVWQDLSWRQAWERAAAIAHGLLDLGLKPGQAVAILAGTREEWALADLGLVMAGGVTVPLYPSNLADLCAYILKDSETTVAIVENPKQLAKLMGVRGELPGLRHVVVIDAGEGVSGEGVLSLNDLEARGRAHQKAHPEAIDQVLTAMKGTDTATIIYTSGTTGMPKGVVLAHDSFTIGTRYISEALPVHSSDVQLLFLPLAHSFGKTDSIMAVRMGFLTAFAESIEKLVDNLGEVRPDWMAAVPRIFEKVYGGFMAKAKAGGALQWKLVNWAVQVGKQASQEIQAGRQPGGLLALKYKLADKIVFSKFRARFGGKLRWFISGSAPLSRELAEFFHAAGILILEGYGLTETNSITSINRPEKFKFGTVGPVTHKDLQLKIAADGEILTKGVTNLREYYKQPEATKEAIDAEGWFHTGDIGELDADGFIRITDRKKDLIKTSGGKYVAPQMIEGQLKMDPIVSQAVVIGDQRKYVTALVALNLDVARKLVQDAGQSAPNVPADGPALLEHAEIKKRLDGLLQQINRKLGSWEQVKYYRVLPRELTEADGELTPSLKIKRKVVMERYRDLIDAMYQQAAPAGSDA